MKEGDPDSRVRLAAKWESLFPELSWLFPSLWPELHWCTYYGLTHGCRVMADWEPWTLTPSSPFLLGVRAPHRTLPPLLLDSVGYEA